MVILHPTCLILSFFYAVNINLVTLLLQLLECTNNILLPGYCITFFFNMIDTFIKVLNQKTCH